MCCEKVLEQLVAYASGEVAPDIRRDVRDHLATCEVCRVALAQVDVLASVLAGAPARPAPAGFVGRTMAAARAARRSNASIEWSLLTWWRLASLPMHAAVAAVLLIGLSVGLMMGWTSAVADTPSAAAVAASQVDAIHGYQLSDLGDEADASLADSFLSLATAAGTGER